jgi:uncharacterized protein involved in type VI secretion and phage assembly
MTEERLQNIEQWVRGHYFGKYRGTVSSNTDSTGRARLKVKVPAVLGSLETWAMPCVPYAGPAVGIHMLPPVGAGVWVEFEGGDVSFPVWVGCFWGDGDLPAEVTGADSRVIVTEQAQLTIDDSSGEVVLKNKQDAATTWNADILSEAGQAKHSVGAAGVVSESAPGKIEVGAGGVSINSGAMSVL